MAAVTKQYKQWLPAPDQRARITDLRTGWVYEGRTFGALHYPKGGWSVVLVTDADEAVNITNDDVTAKRKRLEPV